MLGICNGFQVLCEAGLLPGVLRPNASLRSSAATSRVRVERADTPFTSRCEPGERLVDPRQARRRLLVRRRRAARRARGSAASSLLRYDGDNPNGSVADVAGVINADGNVFGLMPHPEHAVDPLLGATGGTPILASLVDAARERHAVTV